MSWPVNLNQVAYLYSAVLSNINISITSDPNYYSLLYSAKSTNNTTALVQYLQQKVNDATAAYLLNAPQLTLVISVEDENGLWADSTKDVVSNCTLNSAINQLNGLPVNCQYSYNEKGTFPSALYINGMGVDSWTGSFSNSGPNPLPHFRLGIMLFWFSC
jgi:hypothetical protein